MRYAAFGNATVSILPVSGNNLTGLVKNVTPGRVFWMTGMAVKPTTSLSAIWVFDATAGTPATGDAATTKYPALILPAASGVQANAGVWNFPSPGVKFSTGVCAAYNTCGVTTATGGVCCWGYEE